jgi:hypothetical protein
LDDAFVESTSTNMAYSAPRLQLFALPIYPGKLGRWRN